MILVLNKVELEGRAVMASTRLLWTDPQLLLFTGICFIKCSVLFVDLNFSFAGNGQSRFSPSIVRTWGFVNIYWFGQYLLLSVHHSVFVFRMCCPNLVSSQNQVKEFHSWFLLCWNFCSLWAERLSIIWESFTQFQEKLHRAHCSVWSNCRKRNPIKDKILLILRNSFVHLHINSLIILLSFLLATLVTANLEIKGKTLWYGPPNSRDVGRLFQVKGAISDFILRAASKNVLQSWRL